MIKKFMDYLQYFKYKFFGSPKLKQELLLRLALKEKGFNIKKLNIVIDHKTGTNYINGIKLGIKYPDSFFIQSGNLIPANKTISYYFNGNMSETGGRKIMLQPFFSLLDAIVIESDDGRVADKKDKFNEQYFQGLANAKYGLCPHQADWVGNEDSLWTYRFVECCLVEAIPILFKKAPLSENFTKDFYFLWDNQIFDATDKGGFSHVESQARHNRDKAKELFFLTDEECTQIKKTLKISTR